MMDPKDLERVLKDLEFLFPRGNSSSTVTLQAGGIGLGIATVCATVAMLAAIFLGMLWLDAKADIRQNQNDIKAIRAYINSGKVPVQPKGK
jgi:hypothetical protein